MLATASADKSIRLWDAKSGVSLLTLNTGTHESDVAWLTNGMSLASTACTGPSKMWDVSFQDTRLVLASNPKQPQQKDAERKD